MTQQLREQTLDRLRNGSLDIVVATDVAARGIDIERISLVVNYDIPLDAESYVHRIGRTGRAGRSGRALLFVEPRERRLLRNIEHLMKKVLMKWVADHLVLQECRRKKFVAKITKQLEHHDLEQYRSLLEDLFTADQDQEDIAAAMLMLLQGKQNSFFHLIHQWKNVVVNVMIAVIAVKIHVQLNVVANVKAMEIHNQWIYIVSKSVVQMV